MIVIVMGVDGSGKNAVGTQLSEELGCHFFDAADFYSAANVEKMQSGTPLTREDQQQWLASIHSLIENHLQQRRKAVIACTALSTDARHQLSDGLEQGSIFFVFLRGSYETLWERLTRRKNNPMQANMLQSQLDKVAEMEPIDLVVDIEDANTDEIVTEIKAFLAGVGPS